MFFHSHLKQTAIIYLNSIWLNFFYVNIIQPEGSLYKHLCRFWHYSANKNKPCWLICVHLTINKTRMSRRRRCWKESKDYTNKANNLALRKLKRTPFKNDFFDWLHNMNEMTYYTIDSQRKFFSEARALALIAKTMRRCFWRKWNVIYHQQERVLYFFSIVMDL